MEDMLREQKIKITPQRLELIKTLKKLKNQHPSFSEIYKNIIQNQPNVSRSTVHENLKLMVKLGLIQSFHYNGQTHYEMNPELHINLVEANGKIKDIEHPLLKKHLKEIERIIKEEEDIDIQKILVIVE